MSPSCCVTPGKILIIFVFRLELSGMGDYQATLPGAGFAGKSCPAPTGLGLIFVLGTHACSYWSPTLFSLAFSLFGRKSPKEGPMGSSLQMSSAHDMSWDGIGGDYL